MASDKSKSRENGGGEACATELDPCLRGRAPGDPEQGGGNRLERLEQQLRARTGLSRQYLVAALVFLVLLFLLLVVVVVLAACWPRLPHSLQFSVCTTPACLAASAQMVSMMNMSAPPCDDLRQTACGSWLHRNPLPSTRSVWNQQEHLSFLVRQRVRELIGTMPHPTRVSSLPWKVKHFYDSCMALDNVEADHALPLRKIITQLGGWHVLRDFVMLNWDFRRVLELLHKDYGVSPFFKISVTVDGRNPKRNIIQISPAGLGLPDRSYYYRHPDSPVVAAYKRFLKDMVQLLGATHTDASSFAEEMFHFEKRIAEITPHSEELQDPASTYNLMSLEELRTLAQSIPLQEILRAMFPMAQIEDSTELLVVSKQYLSKVSMIISTTDRSALNNYVTWTFASAYLPYLSREFASVVNVYNREMTGAQDPMPRWEFCVVTLQRFMGFAVAALYEKSATNKEVDSQTVRNIFDELRLTMSREVETATWMPAELKNRIYQKVSELTVQVGFPAFMLEDSYLETYYAKFFVQKNDFFQNIHYGISFAREAALKRYMHPSEESRWADALLLPTSSYQPAANRVVVPLSLLQPPYFQEDYPRATLYGSIGVRLSLAVVSSASTWGVLWDVQGRLLLPQRLPEEEEDETESETPPAYTAVSTIHLQASAMARQNKQCLVQSLTRVETREATNAVNRTAHNVMALANAISLAYKTMVRVSENLPHEHQPALEHWDDEALFFIANAQMQCSSQTHQHQALDEAVNYYIGDTLMLRIMTKQLLPFTAAFQCSRDSQFYSRKSCVQY